MIRLDTVLADLREEVGVLRLNGHAAQAATLERACDLVADAARDYLTFLPEHEAQLRSGFGPDYFRARRKAWEEDGLAVQRGRRWFYCRLVVPRRKLDSIVRAEARRGAA